MITDPVCQQRWGYLRRPTQELKEGDIATTGDVQINEPDEYQIM